MENGFAREVDAFWKRIDRSDPDGCWLWIGRTKPDGYVQRRWFGKKVYIHRTAYELEVGAIPDGLVLDHLCRVRHCVNPAHLEPVTTRENIRRGVSVVAQQMSATHCKRGHALVDPNLYYFKSGGKTCRECVIQRSRRQHELNRGAA